MSVAAHYVLDCSRGGGLYWKMSPCVVSIRLFPVRDLFDIWSNEGNGAIVRSSERSERPLPTTCRVAVSRRGDEGLESGRILHLVLDSRLFLEISKRGGSVIHLGLGYAYIHATLTFLFMTRSYMDGQTSVGPPSPLSHTLGLFQRLSGPCLTRRLITLCPGQRPLLSPRWHLLLKRIQQKMLIFHPHPCRTT